MSWGDYFCDCESVITVLCIQSVVYFGWTRSSLCSRWEFLLQYPTSSGSGAVSISTHTNFFEVRAPHSEGPIAILRAQVAVDRSHIALVRFRQHTIESQSQHRLCAVTATVASCIVAWIVASRSWFTPRSDSGYSEKSRVVWDQCKEFCFTSTVFSVACYQNIEIIITP